MTSSNPQVAQMQEAERLNKLEVKITWPDGTIQEKLNATQGWFNWEHNNRGHDHFQKGCYSCACENAY